MSFDQRRWSSTGSADRPMILALRLSNSPFMRAMVPSSVVHTGVKSLGWEKRTAHLSPIHWWKSIEPSVVWASKLGAVSPMRRAMGFSGKTKILLRESPRSPPCLFGSRVGPVYLFGAQTNAGEGPLQPDRERGARRGARRHLQDPARGAARGLR